MSTIDLSRVATDPRKHYAGVRMQQGRVLTDDDFDEPASIGQLRTAPHIRLHAIEVGYGTPDNRLSAWQFQVLVGGSCDFTLANGSLYLGGMRLEMGSADRFLLQKDWLNFDPATLRAPAAPANGFSHATDQVCRSRPCQPPVSAIEDSETVRGRARWC